MPRLRRAFTTAALAGALLAAGCGSGADKPAPLSAAQYKAKANAICRAAAKHPLPFPGKRSGTGFVTTANLVTPYLTKSLARERHSLTEFKALTPPKSQAKDVAELVDAQEARIVDLQQALDSARNRDTGGFTTAFQNDQKQDGPRYIRAATKLGLTDCVRSL